MKKQVFLMLFPLLMCSQSFALDCSELIPGTQGLSAATTREPSFVKREVLLGEQVASLGGCPLVVGVRGDVYSLTKYDQAKRYCSYEHKKDFLSCRY